MGIEIRVLGRGAVQGCCSFLLMLYFGSPVETSVGHGFHQQRFFKIFFAVLTLLSALQLD